MNQATHWLALPEEGDSLTKFGYRRATPDEGLRNRTRMVNQTSGGHQGSRKNIALCNQKHRSVQSAESYELIKHETQNSHGQSNIGWSSRVTSEEGLRNRTRMVNQTSGGHQGSPCSQKHGSLQPKTSLRAAS